MPPNSIWKNFSKLSCIQTLFITKMCILKDEFNLSIFFFVKRNIHRQQSYPTLEVRPLQTVLTILTLQFLAKSELIKHKISVLGGWLKTTKVSSIRHPHLASALARQFPSLKTCCTWTRWNPLSKHLQSHNKGEYSLEEAALDLIRLTTTLASNSTIKFRIPSLRASFRPSLNAYNSAITLVVKPIDLA